MKTLILFLSVIISGLTLTANTGDSCRVLIPALQGKYTGGCKKGLAHGQGEAIGRDRYKGHFRKGLPHGYGTYYWSTGESYTGQWSKGKRNGYGVYHFKVEGRDTAVAGLWKNDNYAGPQPKKPEVSNIRNVDKYEIRKVNAWQNRVLFDFWQNGSRNTSVENLSMVANSGSLTQSGQLRGFDNISFPVTITVRYTTSNKMHTVTTQAVFQITIYEPGDYEIKLFN